MLVFFSRLHFTSSTDVYDIDMLKYSAEKEEPYKLKSVTREENKIKAYSDHVIIDISRKIKKDYEYSIHLKGLGLTILGLITLNQDQRFSSISVSYLLYSCKC